MIFHTVLLTHEQWPLLQTALQTPGKPVSMAPWKLKRHHGKIDASWVEFENGPALRLFCDCASFSIERRLHINTQDTPLLGWSWMVTTIPTQGDFRNDQTDDQAAQIFVMFGKTKVIVYLWDSNAPVGLVANVKAPPFISIKAIVLRSGKEKTCHWLSEQRHLRQDFIRAFGHQEIPPILGIRIQINSQHTKAIAESYFRDFTLSSAEK